MAKAMTEDRLTVSDNREFSEEISKRSGQSVVSCYQCGECTAGCPVAYMADLMPNQAIRMVQLGQEEDVLKSSMIWLCVGCETCSTRCPKGVELSKVMDALRQTAVSRGVASAEPAVKIFHETFLRSVERGGRIHEVSMLGEYKLRSLQLFSDLILAARMFVRGKLVIIPKIIKGRGEVKRIFNKTRGSRPE